MGSVHILRAKGPLEAIQYLLDDRAELEWVVAVGRHANGEMYFYDSGGDIIEDLGSLDYLKARILRVHFGEVA